MGVPSGKPRVCYGKSPIFYGKIHYFLWENPIAMLNYQRVPQASIGWFVNVYGKSENHMIHS
jgi:hypothetical protein